jgi:hypothetical protein
MMLNTFEIYEFLRVYFDKEDIFAYIIAINPDLIFAVNIGVI